MKDTQISRVLRTLKETGVASRNQFLDLQYDKITRLGAVVCLLRKQGYDITTQETKNDTIYSLKPKGIKTLYVEGGEVIKKYVY